MGGTGRHWNHAEGNWDPTGITAGAAGSMLAETGITLRIPKILSMDCKLVGLTSEQQIHKTVILPRNTFMSCACNLKCLKMTSPVNSVPLKEVLQ